MTELSQAAAAADERPAVEAEAQLATKSRDNLQFLFGAQKLLAGEFAFAADEMMERARTETHLFSEFVSKLAWRTGHRGDFPPIR